MSGSPLADPAAVQEIVNDIKNLSDQSIALDDAFDQIKRTAQRLANNYGANFLAATHLPPPVDNVVENFVPDLRQSRDVANLYAGRFKKWVNTNLWLVEDIESDQDRKDAITVLQRFNSEENPLKDDLKKEFVGVGRTFTEIWVLVADESDRIIGVLEKAGPDNLEEVVKKLKEELVPVKEGTGKIVSALESYGNTTAR